MAKNIPDINVNVDTFQSFISRTNEILLTLRSEVLTANSTGGVTGSTLAPLTSVLIGSFTANSISAHNTFSANSSQVRIAGVGLNVNGSLGANGQVLSSNGSAVFWGSPTSDIGGIRLINTGVGLSGGPLTSNGSIQVRANTGIIANNSGIFTDDAHIRDVVGSGVSVSQLEGRTWASPGAIGSTTANTGTFTSVTATLNYRFGPTGAIFINSTGITSPGIVDGTTPPSSSTGGLRVRARADNTRAYIQATNNAATAEWNHVEITPGNWAFTSDLTFKGGLQVGYRNIPQVGVNSNIVLQTSAWGGQHMYKTTTSAISLAVPDNSADPCAIGTAITIINDASTGNIVLTQSGATILQLGGTLTSGNRTIGPGGFATLLKVQTNKWIVSGPGVS